MREKTRTVKINTVYGAIRNAAANTDSSLSSTFPVQIRRGSWSQPLVSGSAKSRVEPNFRWPVQQRIHHGALAFAEVRVDRFTLIRSTLKPTGAEYTTLSEFRLSDAQAADSREG